jgi:hypothetical protein
MNRALAIVFGLILILAVVASWLVRTGKLPG